MRCEVVYAVQPFPDGYEHIPRRDPRRGNRSYVYGNADGWVSAASTDAALYPTLNRSDSLSGPSRYVHEWEWELFKAEYVPASVRAADTRSEVVRLLMLMGCKNCGDEFRCGAWWFGEILSSVVGCLNVRWLQWIGDAGGHCAVAFIENVFGDGGV